MREFPILFSAPMVRELLAGQKTQTRRIVDPTNSGNLVQIRGRGPLFDPRIHQDVMLKACPYGSPGDRLWVRETWREPDPGEYDYRASVRPRETEAGSAAPWRPSIFMPRAACRLELEIWSIRVERVQTISSDDAEAEGVGCGGGETGPVELFRALWDSINGERAPWARNPWVWVVAFRRRAP